MMFNLIRKIFLCTEKVERAAASAESLVGNTCKNISPLKQGNEYLAKGELERAAQCYLQAIEINPSLAEAYLNLGFVLNEQHRYEAAKQALKQAVLLNSSLEDAYYLLAIVSQDLGELNDAIENYNKAIKLKPDFGIAYLNLSRALIQNGQQENAKLTLLKAIEIFPINAEFLYYLGKLYTQGGEPDIAIEYFLNALSIQPGFAEGHNDMGLALLSQDRLDAAIQSYQAALTLKPDYAEAYGNLGFALQLQGNLEDAIANYQKAIAINPNTAIVHNNLASALQAQDKLADVVEYLQEAVKINPRFAEAHNNLGLAFNIQGKPDEAVESCLKALSINPHYAEAHSCLADAYKVLGKLDAAIENYQRALALKSTLVEAHCNMGHTYTLLGNFDVAIECYQQALLLRPNFVNAHLSLGRALVEIGMSDKAIGCFQNAIALKPNYVEAHLNLALSQLQAGNFEQGWAEYEWRWQSAHMQSVKYAYLQPRWLGKESLLGKTILLHYEQGFGDTLQFCRYAKGVAAQGARVLLLVQPELKSLLMDLDGVSQVLDEGEPLPAFDYYCPLMSLPLAFSTNINTIPGQDAYLRCDPGHATKWQSRSGSKNQLWIGLVWSGDPKHKNDHSRSVPLSDLCAIFTDQMRFFSLQKSVRPTDQLLLDSQKHLVHFGNDLSDFKDTAELISNMDLIISVDTSVAHLAGAMGKPVWVLLPFTSDWRWLLERNDCPWYPSARLFRQQKKGGWSSVLSMVTKELKKFAVKSHKNNT